MSRRWPLFLGLVVLGALVYLLGRDAPSSDDGAMSSGEVTAVEGPRPPDLVWPCPWVSSEACERSEKPEMRVWLAAVPADASAACIDARCTVAEARPIDGGQRLVLRLAKDADGFAVTAGGRALARRFTTASPSDGGLGAGGTPPPEAERLRGKALRAEGRLIEAADARARARDGFRRAGRAGQALIERVAEVWLRAKAGELARAEALLALPVDADAPVERAMLAYMRGVVAKDVGDLRRARRSLAVARRVGRRLGTALEADARIVAANILFALGRTDEAVDALETLSADPNALLTPCTRAALLNNLGRNLAQLRPMAADAPLKAAIALSVPDGNCRNRGRSQTARIHLAQAALGRGDTLAAERLRADMPDDDSEAAAWSRLLGARVALQAGRPAEARALLDPISPRRWSFDLEWRRLGLEGRIAESLGEWPQAIAAYRTAEALLDDVLARTALDDGRAGFLADRDETAVGLVSALIERGDVRGAFAAARRGRRRIVEALSTRTRLEALDDDARGRWVALITRWRRLRDAIEAAEADLWQQSEATRAATNRHLAAQRAQSAELLDAAHALLGNSMGSTSRALTALASDGLAVLWHRVNGGWVAFLADQDGVSVHPVPDPTRAPEAALAPVMKRLDGPEPPRRLVVLDWGALRRTDVHAWPAAGRPLAERVSVVYSLDIGASPCADGDTRLVIGDPRQDLRGARESVDGLRARSKTQALTGRAASVDAVRAAWPEASHLHYAGHAAFAGREGWESHLKLAGDGQLTIADILTAPAGPCSAVLAACESARTAADGGAVAPGIGQALVLSGAQAVIAASRVVDDADAARFVAHLYAARDEGRDWPEALQAAQMTLRAERPAADWSAWRALTP